MISEMVYRTNDSATQTEGLEYTLRSRNKPLNFVSFKSAQPFVRFSLNISQMFLSVSWCAEPHDLAMQTQVNVTLQGNKVAKIRNRYNQVPHLTQDTNGKVTNSQKTPQTRAKRSALSQQVTTKHM